MKFDEWFTTFLEEKEIDLEDTIEFDDHNGFNIMPIGVIKEFLEAQPKSIKDKVKDKIVKIDFYNGDVMHFLKYIAKGIGKTTKTILTNEKCPLCLENIIYYEQTTTYFFNFNFHDKCFNEIKSWIKTTENVQTSNEERKKSYYKELLILESLYPHSCMQKIIINLINQTKFS